MPFKDPEAKKAWDKERRQKNKAILTQQHLDYMKSHPEKAMHIYFKGRAKKLGLPFTILESDIVIPAVCPITGNEIKRAAKAKQPEGPTIILTDANLGYVPGNIQVVSFKASGKVEQSKITGTARCPKCRETKSTNDFYGNGIESPLGYCKKCKDEMKNTPEAKTKNAIAKKKHYDANKEEILRKNREYRRANPERAKTWKKSSTEAKMLYGARKRAKDRGVPCTISEDDIFIPEFCPILGLKLEPNKVKVGPNSPSLDCFKPELGYIAGNIEVISFRANTLKSDAAKTEDLHKVAEWMASKTL